MMRSRSGRSAQGKQENQTNFLKGERLSVAGCWERVLRLLLVVGFISEGDCWLSVDRDTRNSSVGRLKGQCERRSLEKGSRRKDCELGNSQKSR